MMGVHLRGSHHYTHSTSLLFPTYEWTSQLDGQLWVTQEKRTHLISTRCVTAPVWCLFCYCYAKVCVLEYSLMTPQYGVWWAFNHGKSSPRVVHYRATAPYRGSFSVAMLPQKSNHCCTCCNIDYLLLGPPGAGDCRSHKWTKTGQERFIIQHLPLWRDNSRKKAIWF